MGKITFVTGDGLNNGQPYGPANKSQFTAYVTGDGLNFAYTYGPANNSPFTAYDRDNDVWRAGNCAHKYQCGWWFHHCFQANLNGKYGRYRTYAFGLGIKWYTFQNDWRAYKRSEMKIRPEN